MTKALFAAVENFRNEYRTQCRLWSSAGRELSELQRSAAQKDTPPYPIETPVVYNRALDEITADDQINIIVIGDNPGKDEQLLKNNRYLVGQSGKIAEGFFRKYGVLKTDFRKNVIILNKTPVHTAKTQHLKYLSKNSSSAAELILQSQNWMAEKTAQLHQALLAGAKDSGAAPCELWLVGYAELKPKGIFTAYRDRLLQSYKEAFDRAGPEEFSGSAWERVFVYQHFSMNRFLIDLKEFSGAETCAGIDSSLLKQNLEKLGELHRKEIFGE